MVISSTNNVPDINVNQIYNKKQVNMLLVEQLVDQLVRVHVGGQWLRDPLLFQAIS